MIIIDPQTRQRVIRQPNSGDILYDMKGEKAIAYEDVPLIGPWKDYTGSNINVSSRQQQQFAATENELFADDASITNGVKIPNLSIIGTTAATHRRRRKMRYASFENGNPIFDE